MKCESCPVTGAVCLGESVPRLCTLAREREDYRKQLVRVAETTAASLTEAPIDLKAVVAEIARCPHRGPVLPASLQPECGCAELSVCLAFRGSEPGRVTTADCLACVVERRNVPAASP